MGKIVVPPLLYHGTTRKYHDQRLELFGAYKTSTDVHLATSIGGALGYANSRADNFSATPILLIVNGMATRDRMRPRDVAGVSFTIDRLNPDEYVPINVPQFKHPREQERRRVEEFRRLIREAVHEKFGFYADIE